MTHPTTGKRFVALSAAAALGVGGALIALPAQAAPALDKDVFNTTAVELLQETSSVQTVGKGENGTIVVRTLDGQAPASADAFEALAEAADDAGAEVVVEKAAGKMQAYNDTDVVGGAGYVVDGSGLCSIGFNITAPGGKDAFLTAGHCEEGKSAAALLLESPSDADANGGTQPSILSNKNLGGFTFGQFGPALYEGEGTEIPEKTEAGDVAVVEYDEAGGFNAPGEVADWSTADSDDLSAGTVPVNGVLDVTEENIGQAASKSGRTTGYTTGTVGGVVDGWTVIEDRIVYGFEVVADGAPGDSGGAVMVGDQAAGLVSGGVPGSGEFWAAELQNSLDILGEGYSVKTAGDSEPSPSPTATETPDPTTPAPTPTETEDSDVAAELTVDPQEIAAERFVAADEEQADAENRGVTYTVEGAEPGSEVVFDTFAAADATGEASKSISVTADENGVASSRIWGLTSAAAEAYIGDYTVVATTEDETLNGSFSVVAGEDEGGEGGEDLPRTGSTVAPLAAGAAGLVALGGALVYVARRRQA